MKGLAPRGSGTCCGAPLVRLLPGSAVARGSIHYSHTALTPSLTPLHPPPTQAVGTDTDPLAVKAAARNAALNQLEGRFTSLQCSPDLAGPEPLAAVGARPSLAGTLGTCS